jgi:N-acetylmuramoyl-L-alanine amidase
MRSSRSTSARQNFLGAVVLAVWFCGILLAHETTPAPTLSATPPPAPPAPIIMIDAAHGGTESGAVLAPDLLEKDLTLTFARRLRQDLLSRGLQARLLRDGDVQLSTDQRGTIVNNSRPALYVCVHMSSQGSGLRLFSTILIGRGDTRGPFVSWQTAQMASLARTRSLQQQLADAIQKTRFPTRSLTAAVPPLNAITVPALAIEIAPANGQVSQLASADYQNMVSAIIANAISTVRTRLEDNP